MCTLIGILIAYNAVIYLQKVCSHGWLAVFWSGQSGGTWRGWVLPWVVGWSVAGCWSRWWLLVSMIHRRATTHQRLVNLRYSMLFFRFIPTSRAFKSGDWLGVSTLHGSTKGNSSCLTIFVNHFESRSTTMNCEHYDLTTFDHYQSLLSEIDHC